MRLNVHHNTAAADDNVNDDARIARIKLGLEAKVSLGIEEAYAYRDDALAALNAVAAELADPRLQLCGVVVHSSWHDPVACAFPRGHDGKHSWASIPQFAPTHALAGLTDSEAAGLAGSVAATPGKPTSSGREG